MQNGATVFGTYNGYGTMIKAIEDRSCFIAAFWVRKGALSSATPEEFLSEYQRRPGKDYVKAFKTSGNTINVVLYASGDDSACCRQVIDFLEDMTDHLQVDYYSNGCAKCGSSIGLSVYPEHNGGTQLCSICSQKENIAAFAQPPQNAFVQPETYAQPQQNTFAQPETYAQPQQNTFVQPETYTQPQQSAFTQPETYTQPQQNTFAQPETYAQPQQNTFAQPETYTQPQQNTFAQPETYTQPQQSAFTQPINMQQMGTPAPEVMFTQPIQPEPPVMSVDELGKSDSMEGISTENTPESTGYATAESLSQLQPQRMTPTDYTPAPIPGDFRSEPEFAAAPQAFNPMYSRPAAIPEHSKPIMGIIGALLFALIGCAVWILIGMAGKIMYIGGLIMGFSTVTGYKLFGQKFDGFGIELISAYSTEGFAEAAEILGYNGFIDVFFRFFEFAGRVDELMAQVAPDAPSIMGTFLRNLMIGYAVSGIGFLVFAIPQFRQRDRYI